jgi:hypothetical protein
MYFFFTFCPIFLSKIKPSVPSLFIISFFNIYIHVILGFPLLLSTLFTRSIYGLPSDLVEIKPKIPGTWCIWVCDSDKGMWYEPIPTQLYFGARLRWFTIRGRGSHQKALFFTNAPKLISAQLR